MKAIIVNFRKSRHVQKDSHMILEVEGVDDVRLDLQAFLRVEAAHGNEEKAHFFRGDVGALHPAAVHVGALGDVQKLVKVAGRENGKSFDFSFI